MYIVIANCGCGGEICMDMSRSQMSIPPYKTKIQVSVWCSKCYLKTAYDYPILYDTRPEFVGELVDKVIAFGKEQFKNTITGLVLIGQS